MGYRARLGRIPKIEKEKYKGKTYEKVVEMIGDDASPYYPVEHEQLYELGKYCEYGEGCEKFYDFDIYEECESEFHIMTKDGLKRIIENYHNIILSYFISLSKLVEEGGSTEEGTTLESYFRSKINEWQSNVFGVAPYYLDEDLDNRDGDVVRSWKYEYAIFNLTYIYSHFDWESDYLIYSAW